MAGPLLLGVNLAGAEFGSNVPGVFGTDYTYPTHTEIDYYAAKGMSVVRLPFLGNASSAARTHRSMPWSSPGSTTW
jgi:aryl-phospho-beta-D-glucosidase BglC (GH1 family)